MSEIVPCPSSPKLVKSMSEVELESIVDEVLNNIIDQVVPKEKTKYKQDLKYIKLSEKQNIFAMLKNFIFYILVQLQLIYYAKIFDVQLVYSDSKEKIFHKQAKVICTESYLSIGTFSSNYEYIKFLNCTKDHVYIKYITNKSILIKSREAKKLFDIISKNLNYHVRYNKIDYNISKYMPIKDTVSVY